MTLIPLQQTQHSHPMLSHPLKADWAFTRLPTKTCVAITEDLRAAESTGHFSVLHVRHTQPLSSYNWAFPGLLEHCALLVLVPSPWQLFFSFPYGFPGIRQTSKNRVPQTWPPPLPKYSLQCFPATQQQLPNRHSQPEALPSTQSQAQFRLPARPHHSDATTHLNINMATPNPLSPPNLPSP